MAGLSEDPEFLTKPEIVQALVAARDDIASLPPSSPPGPAYSDCSSDDGGNFGGDEETDAGTEHHEHGQSLRRRATIDLGKQGQGMRPIKNRTVSAGNIDSGYQSHSTEGRRLSRHHHESKNQAESSGTASR